MPRIVRLLTAVGALLLLGAFDGPGARAAADDPIVMAPEMTRACPSALQSFGAFGGTPGMTTVRCTDGSAGGASAPRAAGAPGTGSISGTVTEEGTGTPLADVCVNMFEWPSGDFVGVPRTDAGGGYVVSDLASGDYHIWFTDCGGGFHFPEWYDDQPNSGTATDIAVTDGVETSGIDALLTPGGGAISGAVIETGSALPAEGACGLAYSASGHLASAGATDASGQYTVGGLPAGPYSVLFMDCAHPAAHVAEWYNNSPYAEHTYIITVANGLKTGGINAALALGASINGQVTEQGSGTSLAGICVDVFDSLGLFRGSGLTDAGGNYIVGGLPSGGHKVRYHDCESPEFHVIEWYNNSSSFDLATVVLAGGPGSKTSNVNASLLAGGSISGAATDAQNGRPLQDICLDVYSEAGSYIISESTDASGQYEVGGLTEGRYKLNFGDCEANRLYANQWWQGDATFDTANLVPVAPGTKAAGISPMMARGGFVNGTVSDRNGGEALPWMCIGAFDSGSNLRGFARSDLLGRYKLVLVGGSYRIFFFDCRAQAAYAPLWYNNRQSFDTANATAVGAPGSKTSGRNAALSLLIIGDVSCDESITSVDALLILQDVAGLLAELPCLYASDVDDDGYYGSVDALLILQYVAGLIDSLPP